MLGRERRVDLIVRRRELHPEELQGLGGDHRSLFAASRDQVVTHAQDVDPGALGRLAGAVKEHREQLIRYLKVAEEVLALGKLHVQSEGVLVVGAPGVRWQERGRLRQVAAGRRVGGGVLRPPPRLEVEPAERLFLRRVGDARNAVIELVHDLEEPLCELRRRQPRQ